MRTIAVISPEQTVFKGTAASVVAPAVDGEIGILPLHAPILTLLGEGELRIGDAMRIRVKGGFMQVADNMVRIVTEKAEELK